MEDFVCNLWSFLTLTFFFERISSPNASFLPVPRTQAIPHRDGSCRVLRLRSARDKDPASIFRPPSPGCPSWTHGFIPSWEIPSACSFRDAMGRWKHHPS